MTCYEPKDSDISTLVFGEPRLAPGGKILAVLSGILSLLSSYLDMPRNLMMNFTRDVLDPDYLLSRKSAACNLGSLIFAPLHLPEKLWRRQFPLPCDHNRCKLRNYIFPPPPWYHPLSQVFRSLRHKIRAPEILSKPQTPFPFLNLPPELRNKIYLHVSHTNTTHSIEVGSHWEARSFTQDPEGYRHLAAHFAEYDRAKCHVNTRRTTPSEDDVSYRLNDNGIIAVHGASPPINLLLVNRQVYEEVKEAFWARTVFEVQPLSPNDTCWRLDMSMKPTYEALAKSKYAADMRKVRVRIDVARICGTRKSKRFADVHTQVCTFTEIELDECVGKLVPLAKSLCNALKKSAPRLKVVEIEWVDDFGSTSRGFSEEATERDLQARAKVLAPFTSLCGVKVRFKRLIMAEEGKATWASMARRVFDSDI
ncbi:hypothetical protein GQ44DRAFT_713043 [Phaeosphaeriaceae sp. PMI808]|nr:hypothetical protein GQ44DRAFT_713043 [Phaeosphaeriaceae sp. PMI808]